jgi:hypothetical protein
MSTSGSARAPRTLADQLRAWSDEQLATLLEARPDVAAPAPHDSSQLAARLVVRASVMRALDQLDTLELAVLRALVRGEDAGRLADRGSVTGALGRLRSLALVWGDDRPVVAVGELLGEGDAPAATAPPATAPPALASAERDPSLVDGAAAGAAFELVRRTELLLDRWGTEPPATLRSGGLAVRDLRAAAELLHLDPAGAALVVETASSAGLLDEGMHPAMSDDRDGAWLPTETFDAWQARPTAERWTVLARAWLTSPRIVSAVGTRIAQKQVNALAPDLARGWLIGLRTDVLRELLALPPGEVLAAGPGPGSVAERVRWRRPRRPGVHLDEVAAQLTQAAELGITGLGGLSSFGRELVTGGDPTATLAALLPQPVDHVLLQADLTAIAPGPLEQELAGKLALVADVESRGGATVYRFDASSVRRAFDAGWSAAEVHDFVSATSRTPVPQALSFLVDDVSRRFGTLRVGQAESFLRSDDETALTELLHAPGAASLRLRRIAPTVLVSDVPLGTLLPRVRALGLAPVVEAPDGTVRVARPDVYRARSPRRRTTPTDGRRGSRTAAVVSAIRVGDRASAARPVRTTSASAPVDVISLLREAAEGGEQVVIGYVGNDGTVGERVVAPERVEGGRLTAYDARSDSSRAFALHRITAVSRAGAS